MNATASRDIVYFDLETQRTQGDVGGWDKKRDMGMSIGVTYSTRTGEYRVFHERKVEELIQQLIRADLVVGFNTINFDYEVLMGYTILDLREQICSFDLLVDTEARLGRKIGLGSFAEATLGSGKTAGGLDAIKWWREGRVLEVAEYCCFDVKATRMLHEYGRKHQKVFYHDRYQKKMSVATDWN